MQEDWASSIDLHLDFHPVAGRRYGLEHALRVAIQAGRLAAGVRLPSTRALAAELGLARNTVSAAYDQLTAEGYLLSRQGARTEVADLADLADDAARGQVTGARNAAGAAADDLVALSHDLRPGYETMPRHDLRPGSPDNSHFPIGPWLRASRRALAKAPAEAFGYGDPRGRIELRTALAEYLGRTRGVVATPEQIIITSGSLQALGILAQVLSSAGASGSAGTAISGGTATGAVAMEDPGMQLHQEAVRLAGQAVVPLPVDGDGARVDLLAGTGARAVVLTPAHQYPTGVVLHPARRHSLTDWARATGGLIIEDDYDGEFRYDRQPVGAIQGIAPDHVAYLGTASKTLGPALRLAWMVLPPCLVRPAADAKRRLDHQTESLGQLTLAELIASYDYDRHIRASRLRYRGRRDLLITRLQPRVGRPLPGYALQGIAAGLHALISLPEEGPSEHDVITRAAARGLALEGLAEHWHDSGEPRRATGIMIGYGACGDGAYRAALEVLIGVLSWP
jgi:GntR family transcriptional regulator / MocR family aminotransferase